MQGGSAGLADGDLSPAAAAAAAAAAGWVPAEGEEVRVLKMGGAVGRVVSTAGRSGGKVSVRVGALTVELRRGDLAPAGAAAGSSGSPAAKRRVESSSSSDAGGVSAPAKGLRARGALGSGDSGPATSAPVAIQTSVNTVDVRGQRADDAASEVQAAVLSAPAGWALFVVHGVGTGKVRAAVLGMLRRHPRVAKLEEDQQSNGGCTIVYVK